MLEKLIEKAKKILSTKHYMTKYERFYITTLIDELYAQIKEDKKQ